MNWILTSPSRRGALAALLVLVLVGCRTDSDLSRFDQTWEQSLDETTCRDWADEMTVPERFAAASDLLLLAREGAPGFPSDGQFTFFMSGISVGCEAADSEATLPGVAAETYSIYESQLSQ